MRSKRRARLYGLIAAAGLILFGALLIGINILASERTVDRVTTPASAPNAEDQGKVAQQEADFVAKARQAAAEQAKKEAAKQNAAPPEQALATPCNLCADFVILSQTGFLVQGPASRKAVGS